MNIISDAASVASFLRGVRAKQGLSQAQLAEVLGVTQSTISKWEHGECGKVYILLPGMPVTTEDFALVYEEGGNTTFRSVWEKSTPSQ